MAENNFNVKSFFTAYSLFIYNHVQFGLKWILLQDLTKYYSLDL